ncbi:putative prolow-density lipoprotein receptor-related [Sesbania bispinosa]|nr:putative prolow-density lipoprotein receptor-related [Sesbania bispinosa]
MGSHERGSYPQCNRGREETRPPRATEPEQGWSTADLKVRWLVANNATRPLGGARATAPGCRLRGGGSARRWVCGVKGGDAARRGGGAMAAQQQ